MLLLRRAYSSTQAAEVGGRLLHVRKKGRVCSYVEPLKINNWGWGEQLSTTQTVFRLVIVAKQLLTMALHKRLAFMPMNLESCATASLPFFRFLP